MDLKLAILFLLVGTIIGLSYLSSLKSDGRSLDIHFWRRRS
jgi:hypothetical protein